MSVAAATVPPYFVERKTSYLGGTVEWSFIDDYPALMAWIDAALADPKTVFFIVEDTSKAPRFSKHLSATRSGTTSPPKPRKAKAQKVGTTPTTTAATSGRR